MASTLMILGAWFLVSAVLCLLLGAVVRRGEEGLDTPSSPAPGSVAGPRAATVPVPAVATTGTRPPTTRPPTTRPVGAVTGGRAE